MSDLIDTVPASVDRDWATDWATPEFWATATPDIVDQCLREGADPNVHNERGEGPLHWVIWSRRARRELGPDGRMTLSGLESGADPSHTEAIIALLLDGGADVNAPTILGFRPLHYAARWGASGTGKILIQAGAEIEAQTPDGRTAMHEAAKHGPAEMIDTLIDAKADISACSKDGTRPLHEAAEHDNVEAISALLDAKVDMDVRNDLGQTPLHRAQLALYPLPAQVLLAAGANVNALDNRDEIPLHWAARDGTDEMVTLLVEEGGAIGARNIDGATPSDLASRVSGAGRVRRPGVAAILSNASTRREGQQGREAR